MTALTHAPTLRGDALLLTHGRPGTERLVAAALLLDGVVSGALDVSAASARFDRRYVVCGPQPTSDPLFTRVLADPPDTPRGCIHRISSWASMAIAIDLVSAGHATPCRYGLSIDAHAEAEARARLDSSPALCAALYVFGLPVPCLPPVTSFLPPAAVAIIAALR